MRLLLRFMVFCRFGKHRKSMEGGPQSLGSGVGAEEEREAARKAAREEQERIQEQYRRLLQRQAEMQQVQFLGVSVIMAFYFIA